MDDDPVARKALATLLILEGFAVHVAGTLQEASGAMDCGDRIDAAVILDLDLPDGNGIELLRRIRAEKRDMRVIVATATSDDKLLKSVRAESPDGLFSKPFEMERLLATLRVR